MMKIISFTRSRWAFALAGIFALALTGLADARAGSKGNSGSRGSRTHEAAPATPTAPSTAQPIQRSQTHPGQMQQRPATAGAQAAQPAGGRFGTGLMAGLLGAGLLGALFGAGLFGGLGSLASILGLVLQVALFAGLIYLAVRLFRRMRQQQPAFAAAPAGSDRQASAPMHRSALGALSGLGSGSATADQAGAGLAGAAVGPAPVRERSDEVGIGPEDYEQFERALQRVQTAYASEDVAALWELATPEMAGYFQEELNENTHKGLVSRISDVRLMQGDLAEAWREGTTDYATVAMRFSLIEAVVERGTQRVVSGDLTTPVEAGEVWTFRRDQGGSWKLSAIQQMG